MILKTRGLAVCCPMLAIEVMFMFMTSFAASPGHYVVGIHNKLGHHIDVCCWKGKYFLFGRYVNLEAGGSDGVPFLTFNADHKDSTYVCNFFWYADRLPAPHRGDEVSSNQPSETLKKTGKEVSDQRTIQSRQTEWFEKTIGFGNFIMFNDSLSLICRKFREHPIKVPYCKWVMTLEGLFLYDYLIYPLGNPSSVSEVIRSCSVM